MIEWLPIETAPKTGEIILITHKLWGRVFPATFISGQREFDWYDPDRHTAFGQPTHWAKINLLCDDDDRP